MYIAMNRFTVPAENAAAFEAMWLGRDSHLREVPGFVAFHLLRGAEADGAILFVSQSIWESEDAFRAWTRSPQFRAAHRSAGDSAPLHQGAPVFEGFAAIQHIAA